MLVEVIDGVPEPTGMLVWCRSSVGEALVRWRGDQPPVRGQYHVEWTIDVDAEWGVNMTAAAGTGPEIRMDDETVVLRGRLRAQADEVAGLELGDTLILLDLANEVPPKGWDSWVEFSVSPSEVEIYPYHL